MYLITVVEPKKEPICVAYKEEEEALRDYKVDVEDINRVWSAGTIVILSDVRQHNSSDEEILDKI